MGQHLTQNANDKQEVTPALQEIKETTDELPDVMSLDNGYMSGNNLAAFDDPDIDIDVMVDDVVRISFGPDGKLNSRPPIDREQVKTIYNLAL